jgi:hypothetical protein
MATFTSNTEFLTDGKRYSFSAGDEVPSEMLENLMGRIPEIIKVDELPEVKEEKVEEEKPKPKKKAKKKAKKKIKEIIK